MIHPDKSQLLRGKFLEYVQSERFERDFQAMHPSRGKVAFAALFALFLFKPTLALAAYLGARRRGFASARLKREYVGLAEIGVPAIAFAASYSDALRQRGKGFGPALLVVALGASATEAETETHAVIAGSVGFVAESPEEVNLARVLADQNYKFRRRRAFPPSLTRGSEVLAFDALLMADHLPRSRLETPRVVCLLDPRPRGLIFPMPPDIVAVCGLDRAATAPANS